MTRWSRVAGCHSELGCRPILRMIWLGLAEKPISSVLSGPRTSIPLKPTCTGTWNGTRLDLVADPHHHFNLNGQEESTRPVAFGVSYRRRSVFPVGPSIRHSEVAMALIVAGRIVPLDEGDPDAVFQGRVFVDDSGTIERVTSGTDSAPSGFSAAPVIDVGDAFVLPGFIDLHNHIGYNTLPLWTEPTQEIAFAHHDSWTRADSYQSSISWPATALKQAAPEALLAHVQLRALVGGTTAIQGWPAANREHVQVLRNIDDETVGTPTTICSIRRR